MSLTLESIHGRATAQCTADTPLGEMLLVRTADGLAGAWFSGQAHHPGTVAAPIDADDAVLSDAARQLDCYFAGERGPFNLPLDLNGTEFQRAVWTALRRIAIGHTQSYGDIARQLGRPSAVRAVGAAVARNPLSLFVPCHRVLGADGSLTGYAGGTQRKKALLEMELQQHGLKSLA
jgi:methylated-DNA-[protein]-cysteine S-methyltransferase